VPPLSSTPPNTDRAFEVPLDSGFEAERRAFALALASEDSREGLNAFLERKGPGIQQIAYRVTDLEAVSAVLRERGLRLLYDVGRRGTSGSLINFVHPKDAGGVLVELVEPAGIV